MRQVVVVTVSAVPHGGKAPRISRSKIVPWDSWPDRFDVQAVVAELTRRVQAEIRRTRAVYGMAAPETIPAPYTDLRGVGIRKILEPFDYVRSNDAIEVAALTTRLRPHQRVYQVVPSYAWSVPAYILATPDEADGLRQQLSKIARDKTKAQLRESPQYSLNPRAKTACLDAVETLVVPDNDLTKIISMLEPFDYVYQPCHRQPSTAVAHEVAALTTRLRPGQRVYAIVNRYASESVFFLATPDELGGIRQQLEQLKRQLAAKDMAEATVVDRLLEAPEHTERWFRYPPYEAPRIQQHVRPPGSSHGPPGVEVVAYASGSGPYKDIKFSGLVPGATDVDDTRVKELAGRLLRRVERAVARAPDRRKILSSPKTLTAPVRRLTSTKVRRLLEPLNYTADGSVTAVLALHRLLRPGQEVCRLNDKDGFITIYFNADREEFDTLQRQLLRLARLGATAGLGESEAARLLEAPEYRVSCDHDDARPDPQPGQVGRMLYHMPDVKSYRWDPGPVQTPERYVSVNVRLFARVRNIPSIFLTARIAADSVDDPRVKAKERELIATALAQADKTRPVYSLACPSTIKVGNRVKPEQVRALLEPYDYVQSTNSAAGHINVASLSDRRRPGEQVHRVLVGHTTFYLNATQDDAEALRLALARLDRDKAKKGLRP
jgi:hypothetical protein